MKRIVLIAIVLITVNATAQGQKGERQHEARKENAQHLKDFSPEEIATLQTKKMALRLDLTEAQQKEIKVIHFDQAKARNKMREENKETKLSKDDRFNRANSQLDKKLAEKAKMKSILSKEQFEKWERGNIMKGKQRTKMGKKEGQQKRTKNRR